MNRQPSLRLLADCLKYGLHKTSVGAIGAHFPYAIRPTKGAAPWASINRNHMKPNASI